MADIAAQADHPVRLIVTDDLRRSRLTTFFRWLLAIPHLIWLYLWSIAAGIAGFAAWIVGIIMGRVPDALHEFLARFVRYSLHVNAYSVLASNPFPGFLGDLGYPVDLEVAPADVQSRWSIGFRWLLALPAWVIAALLGLVLVLVAFVGWFYALITGRMHEGMQTILVYCLRYGAQTNAYSYLLTARYPKL